MEGIARRRAAALTAGLALAAALPHAAADDSLLDTMLATLSARTADGLAGLERQLAGLDPMLRRAAVPVVAALIADSRDEAIAAGVERIPDSIRAELDGYVPREILDLVRWCASCGGEMSLQKSTFRLGLAPAITLDNVIVFLEREDALTDPALWVHELKHVMQFADWGVAGFAARYLEDYGAVEHDAAEFRWQWVQRTGWLERRKAILARR